jgi:ubiquinone/menaquinone biosynthesis C-methylase UbiE
MQVEKIKRIYNKTAAEYDKLVTPCRICQFLTLIHELKFRGNEKVLEVGCGPGELSIQIGKMFTNSKVVGIDISEKMIKLASEKAKTLKVKNVQFAVSDAHHLKFSNESFDVVVTSMLFHWLPKVHKFLSEVHRVLKPRGKIGLISPTPELYSELRQTYQNLMKRYKQSHKGTKIREMIGLRIYSPEETQALLCKAGFNITKTFIMNFKEPLTPEAYIKRIDAITDGKYLDLLPKRLRQAAKKELMRELLLKSSQDNFRTTECSVFVIGYKGEV